MFGSGFNGGFGSSKSGPFGTSFNAGDEDEGPQPENFDNVVQLNPGPGGVVGGGEADAGGPTPQDFTATQAVLQSLTVAQDHANTAYSRLMAVQNQLGAEEVAALGQTYQTLLANIDDVASRAQNAQSQATLTALNRDVNTVEQQAQQFVEAVEGIINERGLSVPTSMLPYGDGGRKLVLVGAALAGLGVVGFGIYYIRKQQKKAEREARAAERRRGR